MTIVADVVHGAKTDEQSNRTFIDIGLRPEIGEGWANPAGMGVEVAGCLQPAFKLL